ncbi:ABC transporter ATP-binding protein [Vibrio renipiscarius]|uniref:Multidrug resistance-like ATP-binding protein MdlA n=1 Tax=Vibrio renipiscarius TaxID=1461322 RepID=A0A0C2JJJ6_9VIBR|nr:ABC transporter transmembrane domain-containing protein [Vibrio renipiscarius]KII76358.1 multidrug ABC transporter ATP-binding protein [Vibrio renipiscarius]KII78119.1 multidrug ABC transporter ATP-binding protein [Vibrio renipiscarius]
MNIIWKLRGYIRMYAAEYMIAIVVLQIVALLNLVPSWLIGKIVDAISDSTLTLSTLMTYLAGIVVSAAAMYGLRFVWQSKLYGASIAITRVMRSDLFARFTTLSPGFYSRRSTGDLMAHATNDLNAVEEATGMGIMTLVDSFIAGFTVILGMVLVVNGELTAVALLPFPLLVFITFRYGKSLHKAFGRAQSTFSEMNEEVRETVAGIRAVRSHGIGSRQERRFGQTLDDTLDANLAVAKVDAAFSPTVQLVYGLSFVISLVYGAWLIQQGQITVGLFTTFTLYLGQLLGPFLQFGWQFNVFQRGSTSWLRLETLFAEHSEVVEGAKSLADDSGSSMRVDIHAFSHDDHHQAQGNPAVLKNIQFDVPDGGLVGITGPTGGGKSTLLQLVLRQFQLESHSNIWIDGTAINTLTFDALRRKLAWVPQKPHLFTGTIAENIALAKPLAELSDIVRVAEMVGMRDEIEAMPQGFDTPLREGGSNLSGGQKQRLTLARALLSDADILLLDDPFSALDMKTEVVVRQNLKQYYGHKTVLLVTQRLTNLIEADHVVVIDEGVIVEQGNHHQLVAKQGWYSMVYQRQSQLGQSVGVTVDSAKKEERLSMVEVANV